nr:hypothetical protein [Tanacetum cinerariifolium]
EHLEFDKVAQALEITKLKRRVKKLERRNRMRVLKLRRLQKVGTSQRVETSDDTVMDDESNQWRMIVEMDQDDVVVLEDDKEEKKLERINKGRMIVEMDQDADVVLEDDKEVADEAKEVAEDAKVDESVDIQGRQAESQAEIYKIDLDHANKVLSMQEDEIEPAEVQEVVDEDEIEPAEVQEVVDVVTNAKLITEVVTAASEITTAASINIKDSTTSTIILAETKSTDKGKGILVEEPKPLKKKQQIGQDEKFAREIEVELNKNIDWDEAIDHVKRKAKEDPAVKRYQIKEKPPTEAQARKNMMVYLKNVDCFKIDYFKGIESSKKQKLDEEVEELKRHLQIVPNEDDDVYTEATPLARKVPVVDYQIIEMNNKPYYKIIRADDTHQLYVSFLSLLRNFNREDLEALWSLVKERFSTIKPKNFSDDFLLVTLRAMFEKPDIHAQI